LGGGGFPQTETEGSGRKKKITAQDWVGEIGKKKVAKMRRLVPQCKGKKKSRGNKENGGGPGRKKSTQKKRKDPGKPVEAKKGCMRACKLHE